MKPGAGQGSPLRVAPGVCRCSVPGPMMGDTSSGVVARRMWPSSVASFGSVTHAPADPRVLYRDTAVNITSVKGGAREPQSGFPDGARGEEGGGAGQDERAREQPRDDFDRGFWDWYYEVRARNNFGMIAMSGTKASLVAMSAGGVITTVEQFGVGFFRPIWFRTRFVSSARALKTNSTSGSRRPVSPSPCSTTPIWCTGRSSVTRRSLFTWGRTCPSSRRNDARRIW